jgi:hypothetical protein
LIDVSRDLLNNVAKSFQLPPTATAKNNKQLPQENFLHPTESHIVKIYMFGALEQWQKLINVININHQFIMNSERFPMNIEVIYYKFIKISCD